MNWKRASVLILILFVAAIFLQACSEKPAEDTRSEAPGAIEDERIAMSVEGELSQDQAISERKVEVEAENGVVKLRGMVASQTEAERAVELARKVDGVRAVHSYLKVDEPAQPEGI